MALGPAAVFDSPVNTLPIRRQTAPTESHNFSLLIRQTIFMEYGGTGHATISGLVYGTDGLYFAELFADHPPGDEADAGTSGVRIWRIVPDSATPLR